MATRGMLMSLSCFFLKSKCTLCKKEKGIILCFIDSNVLFPCFPPVWTGKEPMLFGIHSLYWRGRILKWIKTKIMESGWVWIPVLSLPTGWSWACHKPIRAVSLANINVEYQLHVHFRETNEYKFFSINMPRITLGHLLFLWNAHVTVDPVFYLANLLPTYNSTTCFTGSLWRLSELVESREGSGTQ